MAAAASASPQWTSNGAPTSPTMIAVDSNGSGAGYSPPVYYQVGRPFTPKSAVFSDLTASPPPQYFWRFPPLLYPSPAAGGALKLPRRQTGFGVFLAEKSTSDDQY